MMKMLLLAAGLAIPALPLHAQEQVTLYDGYWGYADTPDCIDASGQFSTCPALVIHQGVLTAEESACEMVFDVAIPAFETALVFDLRCQGEGQTWTRKALFMLDLDGRLNILDDAGARIYLPDRQATGPGTGTALKARRAPG